MCKGYVYIYEENAFELAIYILYKLHTIFGGCIIEGVGGLGVGNRRLYVEYNFKNILKIHFDWGRLAVAGKKKRMVGRS